MPTANPTATGPRSAYHDLCIRMVSGEAIPDDQRTVILAASGISPAMLNGDLAELSKRKAAAAVLARPLPPGQDTETLRADAAARQAARDRLEATADPAVREQVERLREQFAARRPEFRGKTPDEAASMHRALRMFRGTGQEHVGRDCLANDPTWRALSAAEARLFDWRTWQSRFERGSADEL